MILSSVSVKRPVFAFVISALVIIMGLVAGNKLPLREYPDVDPPIVTIETIYPGASAQIVETRITQIIEERIAGIEGIQRLESQSIDGKSTITVEFTIDRDIDGAANDVRDRVSGVLDILPREIESPEIQKEDGDSSAMMWLNLQATSMSLIDLTDYAERYLEDRFATLKGVARVRIGGRQERSMRIWLDPKAMAARGIVTQDIERRLESENVELPGGTLETQDRDYSIRIERTYRTPKDFGNLILKRDSGGDITRLRDVARVEIAPLEARNYFKGNGNPMVGIGIIKQSQANTLEVSKAALALTQEINKTLPEGMSLEESYDSSVFVREAIFEVFKTLGIALILVSLVILLFLGNTRAMMIGSITVPISLIGSFLFLYIFGFTLNLLTLLALVLAIGLVVDDTIVMVENIHRRIEKNEPRLLAAFIGSRQVGFAIIATTVVLISAFTPISFLEGQVGRLFTEFALTMSAAVALSSLVALSLTPMLCSKFLHKHDKAKSNFSGFEKFFKKLEQSYIKTLKQALRAPKLILGFLGGLVIVGGLLSTQIPKAYTPQEDRGAFFLIINGPEGASYNFMEPYMDEIGRRLYPLVENGEIDRLLIRAPRAFSISEIFNTAIGIIVLSPPSERRYGFAIMGDVARRIGDMPGILAFPVMRQGLNTGIAKPVQFVIGGPTYETLSQWRDQILEKVKAIPGLSDVDHNYKETKPQLRVKILQDRAGDLGVTTEQIGRTLETMMGRRTVTTYQERGEEYDVVVEGEKAEQATLTDLKNLYVRSDRTGALIPLGNLVEVKTHADSGTLSRYNRRRALTIEANLTDGLTQGEALTALEALVRENLPKEASIDYKGESLDYVRSQGSMALIFALVLMIVYLVLAAQFESFIHPFTIILSVPGAILGALFGLYVTGQSLNIYSQIGLIMLIGLSAKNGILIVEFVNQLRDEGMKFMDALIEGCHVRFRPIVMTAVTTIFGAIPLIIPSGYGFETRFVLGIVIFFGVLFATLVTLYLIPCFYLWFGRYTTETNAVEKRLEGLLKKRQAKKIKK